MFYKVLQTFTCFTMFYKVLQCFTKFYNVLQCFTLKILMDFICGNLVSKKFLNLQVKLQFILAEECFMFFRVILRA